MKIQDILKRNSLFQNLNDFELNDLCRNSVKTTYKRNKLIIEKDDIVNNLYILLNGEVQSYIDVNYCRLDSEYKQDRISVIDIYSGLEIINVRDIVNKTISIVNVRCLRNSDIVKIPMCYIHNLMNDNTSFRDKVHYEFTNSNNKIITRSAILPALTVEERIISTIGRFAERKIGTISLGKFSIQTISDLSFCSREMASRVFKKFQQQGLITKEGREILISEEFYEHCVKNNVLNKIQ